MSLYLFPELTAGDRVIWSPTGEVATLRRVDGLSVDIMTDRRVFVQTHRTQVKPTWSTVMAKKNKTTTSTDTKVTITLLGDAYVRKVAVTVERGDACVLRTTEITGDPDWNEILRPALAKLTEIEVTPLPDITTTAEDDIHKPPETPASDPEDEPAAEPPDKPGVQEMEIVDPEDDPAYDDEPAQPVASRPILQLQPTPKPVEAPRQKALF